MRTLFCPYRGVEYEEASMSLEHVVPESLGGNKSLSITAEREANNKLGTEVDGPIGGQLFAYHRAKYGLTGHSDAIPEFALAITIPSFDNNQATLNLGTLKDEGSVRLRPVVKREKQNDGSISITVSGDPDEAREIVANMKKAYAAKGLKFETRTEEVQTAQQPLVHGTFKIDMLVVMRFYVKLAVGICHWLAGDAWSRSEGAVLFRRALWSQSLEEFEAVGLKIADIPPTQLRLRIEDSEHLFIMSPSANGYALAMFMFGGNGLMFELPNKPHGVLGTESLAITIDVTTRVVRRVTPLDLYRAGKLAGP